MVSLYLQSFTQSLYRLLIQKSLFDIPFRRLQVEYRRYLRELAAFQLAANYSYELLSTRAVPGRYGEFTCNRLTVGDTMHGNDSSSIARIAAAIP